MPFHTKKEAAKGRKGGSSKGANLDQKKAKAFTSAFNKKMKKPTKKK